ncbi:PEPxxWA-CTERM sorting domain-containing protein [Xylophilus rhododendri]|uniref:PEPxxWA-CTERM sorting domain-containing protein n=1 Tax=Xylophilus rhododendri TaxID=2697032 RepID=A0A857J0D4_9BURK|nr:PEPxxWA-CTERM sorting domain-containing protein [Xylophilus rhododendri]QHI96733.1 PEPxxWA-CTERM sorting domain-containing protein [Xylophilus rhododendri]
MLKSFRAVVFTAAAAMAGAGHASTYSNVAGGGNGLFMFDGPMGAAETFTLTEASTIENFALYGAQNEAGNFTISSFSNNQLTTLFSGTTISTLYSGNFLMLPTVYAYSISDIDLNVAAGTYAFSWTAAGSDRAILGNHQLPDALTGLGGFTVGTTFVPSPSFDIAYTANIVPQALPAVPEPASWALLLAGLGMLGCAAKQRRGARAQPRLRGF